jgi:hypothetical protein
VRKVAQVELAETPKRAKKIANSEAIRGYARFLDGLACLEDINTDAWFDDDRQEAYEIMELALPLFEEARQRFVTAYEQCSICVEWLPEEVQEEARPDVDVFSRVANTLGTIISTLQRSEAPTLTQMHSVSDVLRTWMATGEGRATALRGTRGHFPVGAI